MEFINTLEFWLTGVCISVFSGVGLITISISVIVFARVKSAFAYGLLGLSIHDFCFLGTAILAYSVPLFMGQQWADDNAKLLAWMEHLNDFSHAASIYSTVGIAVERCIVLYWPMSTFTRSKRFTLYGSAVIVFLAVVLQLFKLLNYPEVTLEMYTSCHLNVSEDLEENNAVNFNFVDYYVQWPYIFSIIIIPFVLIFALNCAIFYKIKSSSKERKKMTAQTSNSTICSQTSSNKQKTRFFKRQGKDLIVLFIAIIFLLCQAGCITVIICRYLFVCVYLKNMSELYAIDMFLLSLNSSANFFIYYIFGEKFRAELSQLRKDFRCKGDGSPRTF